MSLTKADREAFLAQPFHVATLSVAVQHRRGPLAVPVWYDYEAGGEPWIITEAATRKARAIQSAGAFTLTVSRTEPSVCYVAVDGQVSRVETGTESMLAAVAQRYLTGAALEHYLENARSSYGELLAIFMEPEHWLSADLGPMYGEA